MKGKLTVTYADGTREEIKSGDLFYWLPGHTVKVGEDAEFVLFSPQDEQIKVINHMLRKVGAGHRYLSVRAKGSTLPKRGVLLVEKVVALAALIGSDTSVLWQFT